MSHRSPGQDRAESFTSLYDAVYADALRFVQRRSQPDHAEDVVAEAFMVVWRRLEELPRTRDDARAWTFGIVRNVLLNRHRAERRQRALGVRLAAHAPEASRPAEDDDVVSRVDLGKAWRLLSDVHQEALSLAVLEGLNAPNAAAVLGISPVAFRLRLSRARGALRLHLHHMPPPRRRELDAVERTRA
jgi:RNA polymerase sigma-70 factor (ECF subfamily)